MFAFFLIFLLNQCTFIEKNREFEKNSEFQKISQNFEKVHKFGKKFTDFERVHKFKKGKETEDEYENENGKREKKRLSY